MAKLFRLYGKKLGDRRTGSARMGSYGEALFYAVFLVIGAAGLYLLLWRLVLPEWSANRRFVEHRCVVVAKNVGREEREGRTWARPEISIRCRIDGRDYQQTTYDIHHDYSRSEEEAQAILDRFEIGGDYPCWYDPADPGSIVLTRRYRRWMWLLLVLPASFMVIGAAGATRAVLRSGTSTERRAALARRAAEIELFDDDAQPARDFPNVPLGDDVTNSPGTELAYRLPLDATSGWQAGGAAALCLFWNGLVLAFVVIVTRKFLAGEGEIGAALLLVPFVAVGLGLLYLTARRFVVNAGPGPTRLEIEAYPLYPGETYDVLLSQAGRLNIRDLKLWLVCQEQATFLQGTNSRTEQHRVCEQQIYHRRELRIEPGLPFEETCTLHVPATAMHSFRSMHNEVKWMLVVRGAAELWPEFERSFPVVVHPPRPEAPA